MTHVLKIVAIALALFVPSLAQAQTPKLLTHDTPKAELVQRFGDSAKSLEQLVYSFVRVSWENKCWDKEARNWRDTTECSTGDGKVVLDAQIAFLMCRVGYKHFDDSIYGNPLKNLSEQKLKEVQEGVDYCEANAAAALKLLR